MKVLLLVAVVVVVVAEIYEANALTMGGDWIKAVVALSKQRISTTVSKQYF